MRAKPPARSAREEILGRIRAASRPAGTAPDFSTGGERGPQPVIGPALVARFSDKARSLASTVSEVASPADAPAAVADYLAAQGLGHRAVISADLLSLDWRSAGLDVLARPAVDADQVGISSCFCAIAETGTLMLCSGPQTPASISLLPETHIALVSAARIVDTMESAFALLRAESGDPQGQLPRAVNFVSGPSRTGDIEQTIVLGAHGPCRVHLIVIGESA